jgi:hypothetical protein
MAARPQAPPARSDPDIRLIIEGQAVRALPSDVTLRPSLRACPCNLAENRFVIKIGSK